MIQAMRFAATLLLIAAMGCSASSFGRSRGKYVGEVQRLNNTTLIVTYYGERGSPDQTFQVPASSGNYEAYLDMVGGVINPGQTKKVACSIGRISMLANGDLVYNVAPGPRRPDAREDVERGSARHEALIRNYPDLTPGHFRPIPC